MSATQNKILFLNTFDDVAKAMDITDELSESVGFPAKEKILLRLVVEEATVNALKHGRNHSLEKIQVIWTPSPKNIAISVKQKGHPFKVEKNYGINLGLSGRGLQLIINIMDETWLEEEEESIVFHMQKRVSAHKQI